MSSSCTPRGWCAPIRRRIGQPAGIRILALLDELGPLGVTALADRRPLLPADRLRCRPPARGAGLGRPTRPTRRRPALARPAHRRGPDRAWSTHAAKNGHAVAERLERTGHTADEVAAAVALLRDVMAEEL